VTTPTIQLSPEAQCLSQGQCSLDEKQLSYPRARFAIGEDDKPGITVHGWDEYRKDGAVFLTWPRAAKLRDYLCQHLGTPIAKRLICPACKKREVELLLNPGMGMVHERRESGSDKIILGFIGTCGACGHEASWILDPALAEATP